MSHLSINFIHKSELANIQPNLEIHAMTLTSISKNLKCNRSEAINKIYKISKSFVSQSSTNSIRCISWQISISDALPEELILHVLQYLSPSEQSKISRTNRNIYDLARESSYHVFYDIFGSRTPAKLKHRQVIGILQNVYLAHTNVAKAKKILCWAASKGYIKFIKCIKNKKLLSCLNGRLNFRCSQFLHGLTPLYLACRQKHVNIVEILITSGNVRINELCSSYSHTISHIAASKGYLKIL
eukprot:220802_1